MSEDKQMELQDRDLLIRLDTKLDELSKQFIALNTYLQQHDGRIREVETDSAILKSNQSILKSEIDKLRNSGNWKDALIGIGTVAALILTALEVFKI